MFRDKKYWLFILDKAVKTGVQSSISLYLAQSSGIISAELLELVSVAFLTAFLSVIQNALLQHKPKYTYEADAKVEVQEKGDW